MNLKRIINFALTAILAINSAGGVFSLTADAENGNISAELIHTASYWGGSVVPTDEDRKQPLDGIKQIFNREGSSQAWRATAYTEFDFKDRISGINAEDVKKATLSFNARVNSNRTFKVKTVHTPAAVDFTDSIDIVAMSEIATVNGLGNSDQLYNVDVTESVKDLMTSKETKIIFGYDSCADTVYLYGKGAEESLRPTLEIELKPEDGKQITINYVDQNNEILQTEYDIEAVGEKYVVNPDKCASFYQDILGKRYNYVFNPSISTTMIESVSEVDSENIITLVFEKTAAPEYYSYDASTRTYRWDFKAWNANSSGGDGLTASGAKLGGSGVYWGVFNIVSTEENNCSLSYTPEYDGTLTFTLGYTNNGMHVLPGTCNNQNEEMVSAIDIAKRDENNELVFTAELKAGTTYYIVGNKNNPSAWICIADVQYTIADGVIRDEISIASTKYQAGELYQVINVSEGISGTLLCAVYDTEGKLLSVQKKECETTQTVINDVKDAKDGTVKVFIWDFSNGIKPLSNTAEKEWTSIADKSYLTTVLSLYENFNPELYQEYGMNEFQSALSEAERLMSDDGADQFSIDGAALNLLETHANLRLQEKKENMRTIINQNPDWLFIKEKDASIPVEDIISLKTEELFLDEWERVELPHTWNAQDGSDGGSDYDRTKSWYRKLMYIDKAHQDKKLYLEFGAAGTQAEVYINGTHVPYTTYDIYGRGNQIEYAHKGGFSKFRFDITDYVKYGQNNLVTVLVNNTRTTDIAPLEGDFNMQGGLYRGVSLVVTENVHVDMMDYASNGVYLTPQKVTDVTDTTNADFNLTVDSKIVNDSEEVQTITVAAELREPSDYEVVNNDYVREHLRFNPEDMYTPGGALVAAFPSEVVTLKPGESFDFKKTILVENPKLWDGLDSPYRYEVNVKVSINGDVVDDLTEHVGFKYCYIPTPEKNNMEITGGKFYLNGREYILRGANKHEDWGRGEDALGYAVKNENRLWDAGIMYELGMNSVRLSHYQHSSEEVEIYDKLGILVWSELGLVDHIINGGSGSYKDFLNVTKVQFAELIKQQYNNPSVYTWSISNELRRELNSNLGNATNDKEVPTGGELIAELNNVAKSIDPIRPTTYAAFHLFGRTIDWNSDTVTMNLYPYWYTFLSSTHGGNESMTGQILYHYNKLEALKPMGVSEYGGSAVVGFTSPYQPDGTVKDFGKDTASQYSTTYQTYVHEKVYNEVVNELPWMWCSYIWQMFDSSSDKKGSLLAGTNDKGLVAYDHVTKKDAYYFYKANWNDFEPFTHIVASDTDDIIRVYSNYDKVQLYLDGIPYGEPVTDINEKDGVVDGLGVFMWYDVPVQTGTEISVQGIND
jgi:beta-galactosidase